MINRNIENCKLGIGNSSRKLAGFTLMELLIVMAILGILAGVVTVSFPSSLKKTRDTQRKSDLKQYQTALETYASANNGTYPIEAVAVKPSALCGAGNPLPTLSNCPNDPKDTQNICSSSTCRYQYQTDASGKTYTLWAVLERPNIDADKYFVVCSSGRSYEDDAVSCP